MHLHSSNHIISSHLISTFVTESFIFVLRQWAKDRRRVTSFPLFVGRIERRRITVSHHKNPSQNSDRERRGLRASRKNIESMRLVHGLRTIWFARSKIINTKEFKKNVRKNDCVTTMRRHCSSLPSPRLDAKWQTEKIMRASTSLYICIGNECVCVWGGNWCVPWTEC